MKPQPSLITVVANIDRDAAAIEAGANEVETLTHAQNDNVHRV